MKRLKAWFIGLLFVSASFNSWGDDEERLRMLVSGLQNSDASVREQACMSLGALGTAASGALPSLVFAISNDPDPNVREEAVKALGKLIATSDSAVNAAVSALKDKSRAVRIAAVAALSIPDSPPERAIAAVTAAMVEDTDHGFRSDVFNWFDKFDYPLSADAAPAILAGLRSGDPYIQYRSALTANSLSMSDSKPIKDALIAFANEGIKPGSKQDLDLTFQAIRSSANSGEPEERYVSFLASKAKNRDSSVRSLALAALGNFYKSEIAQKSLREASTDDPDFRIRKTVLSKLDPDSDPDCAESLSKSLDDSVAVVRAAGLEVIAKKTELNSLLCPKIASLTRDSVPTIKVKSFEMLGVCPSDMADDFLVAGASDPSPAVRKAAVTSLAAIHHAATSQGGDMVSRALLGTSMAGESRRPSRWQSSDSVPDKVVSAVIEAMKDDEQSVSKEAANTLPTLLPLPTKFLMPISNIAFANQDRPLSVSSDAQLAAIRVLGSFGKEAIAFVPQLMASLKAGHSRGDLDHTFEDRVIEALTLIAPFSSLGSDIVEQFVIVNKDEGSQSAMLGIAKLSSVLKNPASFVRNVAAEIYLDDLVEAARVKALSRISSSPTVIDQLIAENKEELKTAKPVEQIGFLDDHPSYRITRLETLKTKLTQTRSRTVQVQSADGELKQVVVDDNNYLIAMGTWCKHSKLLAALLSNPSFSRLVGNVAFSFVFDDEWPDAEEQLKGEIEKGMLSQEDASKLLLQAKLKASNAKVIHPEFLEQLPGKIWYVKKLPEGNRLRPIPGVFNAERGDFSSDQQDLVTELMIPPWISETLTW